MSRITKLSRGARWKRSAGTGAVVAALMVAPAGTASASTASPPTATQTLSTGAYAWHVARSTIATVTGQDGVTKDQDGAGPLHGEFPVVAADGTVQIRRWQWGAVTAFSADTVTVVSDDGYRSDYRVAPRSGVGQDLDALEVGELVTVVGTVEDDHPEEFADVCGR